MTRKNYGAGSLFERSDGRWEATATIGGKRKSFYGKTKGDARQKRKEALAKVARGEYVEPDRQKVDDYLQYWISVHGPTIGISTLQSYECYLYKHCIPALGHIALQKLTTDHIQKLLIDEMWKKKYAASTVAKIHSVLVTAFNDAIQWGKIVKNPAQHIKLPKGEEREHVILTEDQAQHLIRVSREALTEGKQIGALILLLIGTGMRLGEALSLHWRDVDLDKRELRVAYTLSYDQKNHLHFEKDPKTKSSMRKLFLPNIALEALSAHRFNQIEARLAATSWTDKDLVFTSKRAHTYLDRGTARWQFHTFLARNGLPEEMVPHDLRHNVATALLAAGVPMKTVSEMLGHSEIGVTVNVYGHVTEKMQQAASSEIDRIYGQG